MIVRFSPAGKVLSTFSLNHHLFYGDTFFTNVRVGQDGRLYFLQTSPQWGMRVARYTWPTSTAPRRHETRPADAELASRR